MESNRMKISEFAQATGITRRNLLFYDEIGLLCPAMVDKNNKYRYYAYHQIDTANVITVLREIGMPLDEVLVLVSAIGNHDEQNVTEKPVKEDRRNT